MSLKGTRLSDLIKIASYFELDCRALRVSLGSLSELNCPCILHWNMNHFVVLTECSDKFVTINDPAIGVVRLTMEDFATKFTGVALELKPSPRFIKKKSVRSPLMQTLFRPIHGLKNLSVQIFFLAVALEIVSMTFPFYLQLVIDRAVGSMDVEFLTVLALGFGCLVLMRELIAIARSWVLFMFSMALNSQLIRYAFRHLLHLPMAWFERRYLGDVTSRFESINTIQRTLALSAFEGIVDGLMAVVALCLMMAYSWSLGLIVALSIGFCFLVRWMFESAHHRRSSQQLIAQSFERSHFIESVRGVATLKLFNREELRVMNHTNLVITSQNRAISVQKIVLSWKFLNATILGLMGVFVVWRAAANVMDSIFTFGMMFAFLLYKDQFVLRFSGLIEKVFELRSLRVHAERLEDILSEEAEPTSNNYLKLDFEVNNNPILEVRNLCFRHSPLDDFVFSNVSFTISLGETVAVIGASGVGKSSLMKCILGLAPFEGGQVLLGGQDIRRLGFSELRNQVGTVLQDDKLFSGSIAENIAFFEINPDFGRIKECAKICDIRSDIEKLPMQYHTLIGDLGVPLSGGQRQKILLARAIYKGPKLLFLDEATSALDSASETRIQRALQDLSITTLVIAHRRETISNADLVLELRKEGLQKICFNDHP
jgi:ATP-binding cassette, subfamily B, bacterial CvaB/MchF/RaxB